MKRKLLALVLVVVIVLGALYVFIDSENAPLTAARLDVCLGDCLSLYPYDVGNYEVVVEARPLVSGDNGRAEITVMVDGSPVGSLESYFDYDLWNDEPAGYLYRSWVDDDRQLDLVIELITGERYMVGSQDGQLTKLE